MLWLSRNWAWVAGVGASFITTAVAVACTCGTRNWESCPGCTPQGGFLICTCTNGDCTDTGGAPAYDRVQCFTDYWSYNIGTIDDPLICASENQSQCYVVTSCYRSFPYTPCGSLNACSTSTTKYYAFKYVVTGICEWTID